MEHIFPPPFCFLYCNTRWAWGKDGKKFAIPLDETFAAWYYNTCADQGDHTKCASGGIGRLAGFRCQCSLRACGFDSRLAHQDDPNQILLRGWVRIIFFQPIPTIAGHQFSIFARKSDDMGGKPPKSAPDCPIIRTFGLAPAYNGGLEGRLNNEIKGNRRIRASRRD